MMKILLVDDSRAIAGLYAQALIERGDTVVTALSGEEALSLAVREPPDIALIDYHLPDITGDQLTKKLLSHPVTQHVVVAVFSGDTVITRKSLDAGAVDMISKDISEELFFLRVDSLKRQAEHKREIRQGGESTRNEWIDPFPKFRVLFVDDSSFVRSAYQAILEDIDCEVILAENMEEALEKAIEYQPDLAIIDFYMKGGNGDELTKRLLANQATQNVMVVVFTSQGDVKEVALAAGALDVIIKGEDQNIFVQRIASIRNYQHQIYRSIMQQVQKAKQEKFAFDRVKAVLDTIEDPVLAVNEHGVITHANHALSELLSMPTGKMLGQCVGELIDDEEDDCFSGGAESKFQKLIDKKSISHEVKSGTGERIPVSITVSALTTDDRTSEAYGAILVIYDLRGESLKRANKAKDEFLSIISHELRTPLSIVMGEAEILKDLVSTEESKRSLQSIEEAAQQQLWLVEKMIDLVDLESNSGVIRSEPFDVCEIVADLADRYRLQVEEKGIGFSADKLETVGIQAIGDRDRLLQVLHHIIENAIQFTHDGSITVACKRVDDSITFRIQDTGVGMSEDTIKNIFNRFEQGDNSLSRQYGGVGLGLYIANRMIMKMGGVIDVESRKGRGTTFTVSLPLAPEN